MSLKGDTFLWCVGRILLIVILSMNFSSFVSSQIECWGSTSISVEELSYTWKINNFTLKNVNEMSEISSPIIARDNIIKWQLHLMLNDYTLRFEPKYHPSDVPNLETIKIYFELDGGFGVLINTTLIFPAKSNIYPEWNHFSNNDYIFNKTNSIVVNDSLRIFGIFTLFSSKNTCGSCNDCASRQILYTPNTL